MRTGIRRFVLAFILAVFAAPASALAQTTGLSTRSIKELEKAFTLAGYFGVPRYTTVKLPACTTRNRGAVAFDSTTLTLKTCNGTTWGGGGGGGDVFLAGANTFTGTNSFLSGANFTLRDPTDGTKLARFVNSAQATITTRLINVPDFDSYLPGAPTDDNIPLGNGTAWITSIVPNCTDLTGNHLNYTASTNTFSCGTSSSGGAPPFSDATALVKGDVDATKLLRFEVDGFTTGVTRVATFPNADITVAGTAVQNIWNATQVFSVDLGIALGDASNTSNFIQWDSTQTPTTGMLYAGSNANSWVIAETADSSFNFAHPLQTNPTLFIENAATDTTQHNGVAFYGNQGRAIKALTESVATTAVQIPVAAGAGVGGTITFTAFASDGTDHQTLAGVLQYAAVNKAATETCATPTLTGTALNSVSLGTLTCTYACSTTPANAVDIQFNCVSSLTQTTLDLYWRLNALGASEPLPQ